MYFAKSRVYTALNGNGLHEGDLVITADSIKNLKESVAKEEDIFFLDSIESEEYDGRFFVKRNLDDNCGAWYALVYLVCPAKNAEAYKAYRRGEKIVEVVELEDGERLLAVEAGSKPSWFSRVYQKAQSAMKKNKE